MEKKNIEKIEHKNIYAALSAFQGELTPMEKNGVVEFPTKSGATVKFNYTPLGDIMKILYPLLSKHGLSVRHEVTKDGVEAILTHETYSEIYTVKNTEIVGDGAMPGTIGKIESPITTIGKINQIRSGVVSVRQGGEMKDVGAAITYARRYTLTMLLGISSEDDKDVSLMEQSAKNAMKYAYTRARKGIEDAKTASEIDKTLGVLRKDLEAVKGGKAGGLGLSEGEYNELIEFGEQVKAAMEIKDEPKVESTEEPSESQSKAGKGRNKKLL